MGRRGRAEQFFRVLAGCQHWSSWACTVAAGVVLGLRRPRVSWHSQPGSGACLAGTAIPAPVSGGPWEAQSRPPPLPCQLPSVQATPQGPPPTPQRAPPGQPSSQTAASWSCRPGGTPRPFLGPCSQRGGVAGGLSALSSVPVLQPGPGPARQQPDPERGPRHRGRHHPAGQRLAAAGRQRGQGGDGRHRQLVHR